jgi:thioredoxin 1
MDMDEIAFEKITSDQFVDRIVLKQVDALLKISTAWSGASQILCRTFHELSSQYSGKVDFFSMEYDAESPVSLTYRIDSVPTILFFKKGTLVDKLSGLNHQSIISEKINNIINI